jgi:polysaccharide export outer membrane protein
MPYKNTLVTFALAVVAAASMAAQQKPAAPPPKPVAMPPQTPATPPQNGNPAKPPAGVNIPAGVPTPADYVIGPDDVLTVVFWREKDLSGDVAVRPDGMITLPLLNDVKATGLTPEQLRDQLTKAAEKFVEVPSVTVVVKQINSRKVFVTGMVGKAGPYPLTGPTTVMQMLAMAGGVHEFADQKNITILRTENGRQIAFRFNYKDVKKRKNLKQNIELKPGDTIIVP